MEREKEPNNRYFCSFGGCSAAYNKQWKLDAHLCKHTGVKPYTCEHEGCGKSFCDPYHLARHELTHNGEKPFGCTVEGCAEAFTTNSNRARHMSRVHAQEHKKYVCTFEGCGLEFKKNKQRKSHMCEEHSHLPPYRCAHEGCQMRFAFPSMLRRHEKVHRGYPCTEDACSFTGKTWTQYQRHRKEQHRLTLRCDKCSRVFRDSWFLQQHQHVHCDTRVVYKCPEEDCERTYTTTFNLQSHIRSFHEELKPFACTHPGCEKTFAMKQSLRRHSVAHDPERKKQRKPNHKRSLCSRLSGYNERKTLICKKPKNCEAELDQQTAPRGSVELVSLLQDTSLLCGPAVDAHGLTNALTAPLTV